MSILDIESNNPITREYLHQKGFDHNCTYFEHSWKFQKRFRYSYPPPIKEWMTGITRYILFECVVCWPNEGYENNPIVIFTPYFCIKDKCVRDDQSILVFENINNPEFEMLFNHEYILNQFERFLH